MQISVKSFDEFQANYSDKLGLVLLGAGEPHEEWRSGLADLLVDECDAVQPVFSEAFALSGNLHGEDGRTDLVLVVSPESKVNVGKLAMFRMRFGDASWLDDFIYNYGKDYGYVAVDDDGEEDSGLPRYSAATIAAAEERTRIGNTPDDEDEDADHS